MDPILAQIILWPGTFVPKGWLLCNGATLNVTTNTALFSLLGTVYGGNGSSTFGIPDLRNRVAIGTTTPTAVGVVTGATTSSVTATGTGAVTITVNNLPAHSHAATFSSSGGTSSVQIKIPVNNTAPTAANPNDTQPSGKYLGVISDSSGSGAPSLYANAGDGTTLAPFTVNVPAGGGSVSVGNTGNGAALPIAVSVPVTVSTLQPSLALNFIIASAGIYPTRN